MEIEIYDGQTGSIKVQRQTKFNEIRELVGLPLDEKFLFMKEQGSPFVYQQESDISMEDIFDLQVEN